MYQLKVKVEGNSWTEIINELRRLVEEYDNENDEYFDHSPIRPVPRGDA